MKPDLQKALKAISNSEIIAFDVETDGLNVRKNKCIGLGIACSEDSGFYFHEEDQIKLIANALSGKKLIAWNAYFDLEIIRNNYNIDLWDFLHADTLCLKHTVDEEPPFGLKEVATEVFGIDSTVEQKELKESIKKNGGSPKEFFKADLEVIAKYCIQDCKLTLKLFNYYSKTLKEDNLEDFFYKDEVMPLYKEVTRFMQSNGIPVDIEKTKILQEKIEQDINHLANEIYNHIKPHLKSYEQWYINKHYPHKPTGNFAQGCIEISGIPTTKTKLGKHSTARAKLEPYKKNPWIAYLLGLRQLSLQQVELIQKMLLKKDNIEHIFNLNSKSDLKKLFFEILGEKPLSLTKLGNPQVNDEFIEKMAKKHQWCRILSDYNKLNKLKSSYIDRILEKHEDGIFYPQFRQHRTVSGRYGSDLQQLPRLAEDGDFSPIVLGYRNQIRSLFVAGPSHKFIDADYESLEPHIFAHISNEDKIKDIFKLGNDFYSTIAIEVENIENVSANKKDGNFLGKVNKKLRQAAKAYALGIPYGMESYALSLTLKIEQNKAEMLIENYLKSFPNLKKWMKETDKRLIDEGYVSSEAKRIRRFKSAKSIIEKFGVSLLDSLELWKQYANDPALYEEMKKKRIIVKNALNNAKNFQIQSLGASITNRACIAIAKKLPQSAYICAQIHDQIVVRCKEEDADIVKNIVQQCMENTYKISIPLKAPAEIGDNLAESH